MGHKSYDNSEKFERELIPTGTYSAICYSIIDLGTHIEDNFGNIKPVHKVQLGWEIPELAKKYTPKDSDEEKTYIPVMYKEYTDSLHEKSNLSKDLIGWRGRKFTPEELKGFDLKKVLGVVCELIIGHTTSKSTGNEYEKVSVVSKLRTGLDKPELTRPTRFLSFQEEPYDENLLHSLPEFMQNKIISSIEYKKLVGNKTEVTVNESQNQPESSEDGFESETQPPDDKDDLLF